MAENALACLTIIYKGQGFQTGPSSAQRSRYSKLGNKARCGNAETAD